MLALIRIALITALGVIAAFFLGLREPVVHAPASQQISNTTKTASSTEKSNVVDTKSTVVESAAPKQLPAPLPQNPKPQPKQTETPKNATSSQSGTLQTNAPIPPVTFMNDLVRSAVVNIMCTTETSGPFDSISGSGVVIDSRGIILTNAHVGQFFLLKDYPSPGFVNCIVRTGSPAYPRYTAELLFLPPSWIAQNAKKINEEDPTGNGEHDYAFVRITGTVNPPRPLPATFPALSISLDPPSQNENMVLAAYPAGFLGGITISENLYLASAYATVGNLYTFDANTIDLFSIGGTVISQKGSSGGAAADQNGTLLGLIVTATDAPQTGGRDLRAISTAYIISDFAKESGTSLEAFLSGDISAEAQAFATNTLPALRQKLVEALEKK